MHRIEIPTRAAVAIACLPWLLGAAAGPAPRFEAPVRGITLSTHLDGRDWGWDPVGASLERIRETGANWVAIHPYATIRADGGVSFSPIDASAPPAHIARPIREAHELGLKILIKPHLAYWGSPFAWRGAIEFDNEAAWERFWADYSRFILTLAEASQGADGFVVGTELKGTLGHVEEWRALIAGVREVTRAPLTYAANWDVYDEVGFWTELDAVGIQGYFPLTDEERATPRAIRAGWKVWIERLRALSERVDRPILLTELGYNHSFSAAARPWEYENDGEAAREVQRECLRAALAAVEAEPRTIGVFLWKWFPEPRPVGRNFQLAVPAIVEVIREAWNDRDAGASPLTAE